MIEHLTDEASLRRMSDRELLAAWNRTDGEGDEAERLCAEIAKRNLDL